MTLCSCAVLFAAAPAGCQSIHTGSVQASYFHAWFPSNPLATAALFADQGG